MSIVFGIFLVGRTYLLEKKNKAYENIGFVIYNDSVLNELDNKNETPEPDPTPVPDPDPTPEPDPTPTDPTPKPVDPKTNYIGTIEISKINLKKGFVDPSSKYNNIKYNVTILKGSQFPDVDKGLFILAAHSGTSSIAFFKNLYKLKLGDTAKITYKGNVYVYKIVNIYYQKKQGYVEIRRNANKKTLMLVTCTKDNKKSQTVYIAELI